MSVICVCTNGRHAASKNTTESGHIPGISEEEEGEVRAERGWKQSGIDRSEGCPDALLSGAKCCCDSSIWPQMT